MMTVLYSRVSTADQTLDISAHKPRQRAFGWTRWSRTTEFQASLRGSASALRASGSQTCFGRAIRSLFGGSTASGATTAT